MSRKILIVDDIATNRRILNNILSPDYDVLEAESGEAALAVLAREQEQVSAVLLDISMPDMDGYEVLRRIRDNAALTEIPVIMITGHDDDEARVKSLSAGANDFMMKPYKPDVIKHCLETNIALHESIATIQSMQRDKLTGLYNREPFFQRVQEMVGAHEPGYYILACFDVDNFKMINDQYGMQKGDAVLRHIGNVFKKGFVPNGGLCCRISSDNFAVLYPASFQDSEEIAAIRRYTTHIDGLAVPINFSIGRYLIDDLSLPATTMYDRANMAADSVKGRYDNKIAQYAESMRERLLREQEIVHEMEAALKARQFEVWFQPQYNHSTGAMIGAEALVRWRHPKKGLIPPGEFISVFEQNGFIYELDKFVWEEVCRYQHKWLNEGLNPLPVSVNISRYDVLCPDIIEVITGLVKKHDIPIDLLRLEITESAFSKSAQIIIEVVKTLIDYGFTVEIDDFGSGYSSLNTLKDVPAQIIKLDMKFLESSSYSQRGGNIVESVVRMAKWLGMSVIAEGVETLAQANYLRSIGCSYMQGYLYARPMPAEQYEEHCAETEKEEHLLALETVENLNNNSFWDPDSMDTLIFNSYVGGACIYEYQGGNIELLRATEKYAQVIGSAGMTVEDALKLNWAEHLDAETAKRVTADLEESIATNNEVTGEYVFLDLPGCPHETYLRSTMRVIASAGERYLVYCSNENITAQRQAEQREREVAEEMRLIMAHVNSGICATVHTQDGDFRILFANDHFYSMYGYTREQMEAELGSALGAIHPDDLEKTLAITDELLRNGGQAAYEYRCVKRDSSLITVSCSNTVASFPGISDTVLLAVVNDITEQVESDKKMRALAEQLQIIMKNVNGGITATVIRNGQTELLFSNDKYYSMRGYTQEQYRAEVKDYFAHIHADDKGRIQRISASAYAAGKPIQFEYRYMRRDGAERWFRVALSRTRFTDIEENVALSIYTDITDEKQSEQCLWETSEQLRSMMDDMPGGFCRIRLLPDGGMIPIYVNEGLCQLTGMSRAEIMEVYAPDVMAGVHPNDGPSLKDAVAQMLAHEETHSSRYRLLHKSGGYIWLSVFGRVTKDLAGDTFLNFYYTDATEQVQEEQRQQELLDNLPCGAGIYEFKNGNMSLTYQNKSFWELVGLSEAAFPDSAPMSALHPDDIAVVMQELSLAIQEKRDVSCYIRLRHLTLGYQPVHLVGRIIPRKSNGFLIYATFTPVSAKVISLKDSQGNIVDVYGGGRDVTETRKMQSQFELLTNSIPGGIATYSYVDGIIRVVNCNDGFCALFGGSREGFIRRGDFDPLTWVFKEDYPTLLTQVHSLVHDGEPVDCVFRIHVIGGGYKWINERAIATERNDGMVLFNAVLLDITERQEAAERVRISEEEYRLAMEFSGATVGRYTIATRTLRVGADAAARNGHPPVLEDVPYSLMRLGLIASNSQKTYIEFFEDILNGKPNGMMVFYSRLKDGWCWQEANFSTIYSAGKPVSAVISFVDVTERLEKERVYKKWQQSLYDMSPESYTLFRCNLDNSADFGMEEGTLLAFNFDEAGSSFGERAREYIRRMVYEEDRERYAAIVNTDTLLANYHRGKKSNSLDYREYAGDKTTRWLRLTIDLIENPASGEIEAFLLYEDIDTAKKAELQTKEMAESDPLTGLLNRAAFADRVEEIIRTSKSKARHALLMLDIDGFKRVNDVFGHGAGDQTLKDIANGLRAAVGSGDLVARLGGDEFVLFLNDIPDEHAVSVTAKQICAISHRSLSMEVEISGSVGIAIAPPDGSDFEALYKKADSALYYVKGSGKNNYVFYRKDMADEHLAPEADVLDGEKKTEKKRRMLIVEDNAIDHALLQNIFKDEFIIERAPDGHSALIRLRHYGSAISVVLLDLMMPGINGFAVLEKMQASAQMRTIPILIVSGDESRETCLKAIRAGATDFVTKPVDADILRIRVHSAVSKAENERLRAKNNLLEVQNEERERFEAALQNIGIAFVELDLLKGEFLYHPSISKYLHGIYDARPFWEILLSDLVADTATVGRMRQFVHSVAESHAPNDGLIIVKLMTPEKAIHRFRMSVRKMSNEYQLTNRLTIILDDLDFGASDN